MVDGIDGGTDVVAIDKYVLFGLIVDAVGAAIGEFNGNEACLNAFESMDKLAAESENVDGCNRPIDDDSRRDRNGSAEYD